MSETNKCAHPARNLHGSKRRAYANTAANTARKKANPSSFDASAGTPDVDRREL